MTTQRNYRECCLVTKQEYWAWEEFYLLGYNAA
jgi:hypothetical protein